LGVFRALLPKRLKDLSKIPDPRQPKKVKHKLSVVLLYGLLSFVLQMASRREANRETKFGATWTLPARQGCLLQLSRPAFLATLQALCPELESLPHGRRRWGIETSLADPSCSTAALGPANSLSGYPLSLGLHA
jgi:hypothetical protein